MEPTTRVDLHCHSVFSDGALEPRELAEQLAADGVAFAALTDHDTVDGLVSFREALARQGIGFLTGLEITAQYGGAEVHVLAYGFDPGHPELLATVASLRSARQAAGTGVQSLSEALRKGGARTYADPSGGIARSAAPAGTIEVADAIDLVHRAGGRAILAHPLARDGDLAGLEERLTDLQAKGLDGIEVLCPSASDDQRDGLRSLAERLGLLVTGGSDVHERRGPNGLALGVEMPTALWRQFRDAVCSAAAPAWPAAPAARTPPRARPKRRHFVLRILCPALLAMVLFAVVLFAVFLPAFQRSLVERKREMIRELTNSAWSILAEYEGEERAGALTREQAQRMAASRIEFLRYGREGKDYFWLQDMQPRIVMHPYRADLNGQDVSEFRDPRGVRIFVEFADVVRRQHEGYIEYVWQWKDDPTRLAAKESYIKGFEPWGWIIGTGVYVEDVNREAARVQGTLVHTSLAISLVVALLLLYVIQQSLRIERERSEAEEGLREWTERYRSLVEATTEGTLLVLDGRCRYANPTLLQMLGCAEQELELLDPAEVLPDTPENGAAWAYLRRLPDGEEPTAGLEGVLRRRNGDLLDCVLALSPISFGEKSGFILLAKGAGTPAGALGQTAPADRRKDDVADGLPVGIVRARATARGTVVHCNALAAELLSSAGGGDPKSPLLLSSLFREAPAFEGFLRELESRGTARRRLHVGTAGSGVRTWEVVAALAQDDRGGPAHIDACLEDVTRDEERAAELRATAEGLQASLLFLHEPVSQVTREAVSCELVTPIQSVAARMSLQGMSAALVRSESGVAVGIVTDPDIRERVVAEGVDRREPVHRIMSSPLVTIAEHAGVYEALLLMEAKAIQHLAVTGDGGEVVGVVHGRDLLQFRNYGPIVLAREIARAATPEEVAQCCRRTPSLANALLASGARPDRVTRMITSVCDAATERFVALAQERLGPAPAPFAFVALGSHGRQELTLHSDQDNALIYAEPEDEQTAAHAAEYLLELGRVVCEWLEQAGYPVCRGGVMARNPRWCQPLSVWKRYFTEWIRLAEPQQLLEMSIFFDLRTACGPVELVRELRAHIHETLRSSASFYPHFAQNSLLFRPPLSLLGKVLAGGPEHTGQVNLKDALVPITNFARLYALRHGLESVHTLSRLEALAEAGVLPESSWQETATAYRFLMRLRLQHHAEALGQGAPLDNLVTRRRLGHIDETLLAQSFAQIAAIQKRISYDFLGGA